MASAFASAFNNYVNAIISGVENANAHPYDKTANTLAHPCMYAAYSLAIKMRIIYGNGIDPKRKMSACHFESASCLMPHFSFRLSLSAHSEQQFLEKVLD